MSPPKKQQQPGIATDLTEIAMTIVVAASTKHSGPLSLQCRGLKVEMLEHQLDLNHSRTVVFALTHMSCKVGCGRMSYHSWGKFLALSKAENRKTGQLNRLNFWFTSKQYPFSGIKISHCRNPVLNNRTIDKVTNITLYHMRAEG